MIIDIRPEVETSDGEIDIHSLVGEFSVVRASAESPGFAVTGIVKNIEEGNEGPKAVVTITVGQKSEEHEYFIKSVAGEREARRQRRIYSELQQRGIDVPKRLLPCKTKAGEYFMLISDQTEHGKYDLLPSTDIKKTQSLEYQQLISGIQPEQKDTMKTWLANLVQKLSSPAEQQPNLIFQLQADSYFFKKAHDSKISDGESLFVGDFGHGISEIDLNAFPPERRASLIQSTKYYNEKRAILWYKSMTNEDLEDIN